MPISPREAVNAAIGLAALSLAMRSLASAAPPEPPPGPGVAAPTDEVASQTITIKQYLVLPAVGHYGRLPLARDAVEALLVTGDWQAPSDGSEVETDDGDTEAWHAAAVNDSGALETNALRGGYAWATFDSPAERVMLLEASGHAAVYVNGQPHTGDPYRVDWLRLPILLRDGENTLLFHLASEQLVAKFTVPPANVFFADAGHTLPTLVRGEAETLWAAVPVVNASRDWLESIQIECTDDSGGRLVSPVAPIPPLSVRKIAFQIPASSDRTARRVDRNIQLVRNHDATDSADAVLATAQLQFDVAEPSGLHVRTFRSRIDGSVQPYAVRPAKDDSSRGEAETDDDQPGLIIALHDAGIDCKDFVAQLAPQPWAHVVAPMGRGTYGFDWEDWGRIDVLEALADARKHYRCDPRRTYLTGQAMGGHGAWHLGATYPDQFAAIGPSGGWPSFWSYGGGMPAFEKPNEIESLLLRGNLPSDTLQLLPNLAGTGVYVLHDSDDQRVPVAQARFMRNRLAEFHPNFVYYEHSRAADPASEPGCDWPRMMEFFRHLALPLPAERQFVDFTTASPGVSDRCDWVRIDAQDQPLQLSRATIRQEQPSRTFVGRTSNVSRLAIDVNHWTPDEAIQVALDGQPLPRLAWPVDEKTLWFERHDGRWAATTRPLPQVKGPLRCGTFKSAFDHHAVLVFGTAGTPEENAWAEAKARFDAETFWYRGGGALEVLSDTRFDPHRDADRNVVLYGNAETNGAWPALLSTCPVQVRRGQVRVGMRPESGEDLAVLLVYPRLASDTAVVGVVSGTGLAGMRLTNRLRYVVSGVAYPDLMIFGPQSLQQGGSDVRAWGYFSPDWKVDSDDIAWRDVAL